MDGHSEGLSGCWVPGTTFLLLGYSDADRDWRAKGESERWQSLIPA